MLGLIITIVFGLGALLGLLALLFGGRSSSAGSARAGGAIILVVCGFIAALPCFTTVDARAVGVQTSFGRYQDTLGPGFQWVAPWSDIEEWTTRLQTSHFAGDGEQEERDNFHTEACISVKMYAEQPGCVSAVVEWAVTEDSVEALWRDHKDFESARRNYVNTEIRARVADAFEGFDPLLKLREPDADPKRGTREQFAALAGEKLKPKFTERGLALRTVRVTHVDYSDQVDQLLRDAGTEVARTRLAEQRVDTAKAEADAAKERNSPTKIRPGCEALIRDLAAANQLQHLPAGWQCPGGPQPITVVGR